MVTKTFTNIPSEEPEECTNDSKIYLESRIQSIVEEDNVHSCTVHLSYSPSSQHGIDLSIITHNPVHGTNFLFYKTWGLSEENALRNAYDYLSNHRVYESTYTMEWKEKGGKITTSYFTGKSMLDVLHKFYFNKTEENYTIFLIKLNPIS